VIWKERAKIEEDPLKVLTFSTPLLIINQYKQKHGASEKRDENCHVLPIASGQFYLLSYWLKTGICAFPSEFPIPSKNCPEAI
jgi:hypothetical protein